MKNFDLIISASKTACDANHCYGRHPGNPYGKRLLHVHLESFSYEAVRLIVRIMEKVYWTPLIFCAFRPSQVVGLNMGPFLVIICWIFAQPAGDEYTLSDEKLHLRGL